MWDYRHRVVAWHEAGDGVSPRPCPVPAGMLQLDTRLLGKKSDGSTAARLVAGGYQQDLRNAGLGTVFFSATRAQAVLRAFQLIYY